MMAIKHITLSIAKLEIRGKKIKRIIVDTHTRPIKLD
uniref:Uncharacterized protein n=1 Tax=Anguilla anguilla TaxID=7936 RepID=A0A0E9PEU8_ANGAN